jgi:hypothetical protein
MSHVSEQERPRERKLDIVPPTLTEIDQRIGERIAAEHEFMIGILAELLAHLQRDAEMRGPPGPAGPRGEQGPPGKLPLVRLWEPETVYYEGDVVAYDGAAGDRHRDWSHSKERRRWQFGELIRAVAPAASSLRQETAYSRP